jgi:hypothetical protein
MLNYSLIILAFIFSIFSCTLPQKEITIEENSNLVPLYVKTDEEPCCKWTKDTVYSIELKVEVQSKYKYGTCCDSHVSEIFIVKDGGIKKTYSYDYIPFIKESEKTINLYVFNKKNMPQKKLTKLIKEHLIVAKKMK